MKYVDEGGTVRNSDGSEFVWDGKFTTYSESRQKFFDDFFEEGDNEVSNATKPA